MRNQVSLRNRQASRARVFRFGAIAIIALLATVIGVAAFQGAATSQDYAVTSLGALPFLAVGGLMFREKPDNAGGGGSSTQNETCPTITGDSLESKVESASGTITSLWSRLTKALGDLTKSQGDYKTLETQFNTLKETAQTAQTDLATARGEVTRLTTELGTANTDLAREKGSVTRLESLCQLKGIDTNAVVPPAPAPATLSTVEEWNNKLAAAKGNDAQMQVLEEFQAAVKAGQVKKSETA